MLVGVHLCLCDSVCAGLLGWSLGASNRDGATVDGSVKTKTYFDPPFPCPLFLWTAVCFKAKGAVFIKIYSIHFYLHVVLDLF